MGKPDQLSQDADESLKRIRNELKELLNRSPGAREVLPHLAVLEHALKSHGVDALDGLPPRVLTRATTQLLGVLSEPLSEGMTELRAWLSRALLAREEDAAEPVKQARRSTDVTVDHVDVSESSLSDFMRVVEAEERKF
jgi:hypothetical protein